MSHDILPGSSRTSRRAVTRAAPAGMHLMSLNGTIAPENPTTNATGSADESLPVSKEPGSRIVGGWKERSRAGGFCSAARGYYRRRASIWRPCAARRTRWQLMGAPSLSRGARRSSGAAGFRRCAEGGSRGGRGGAPCRRRSVVLLTRHDRGAAEAAARQLGIGEARAEALTADEAGLIAELRAHGPVAMVSDGVNAAADPQCSNHNTSRTMFPVPAANRAILSTFYVVTPTDGCRGRDPTPAVRGRAPCAGRAEFSAEPCPRRR